MSVFGWTLAHAKCPDLWWAFAADKMIGKLLMCLTIPAKIHPSHLHPLTGSSFKIFAKDGILLLAHVIIFLCNAAILASEGLKLPIQLFVGC